MKICLITNLYPPYSRGGAEHVVFKTVRGMLDQGHEVVVITTTPDDNEEDIGEFLSIYHYKPSNLFFYTQAHKHNVFVRALWHIVDMFHFGSARYVKDILEKEKPDVVHTHNLMGIGFLIPAVIRKLKIKHLHTVHDVQLVEPSGIILKLREKDWRYNGLPTKIYTWFMRHLIGSPDVVISPSQFLLDFYSSRNFFKNSKKVMLRNPVTLDEVEGSIHQYNHIRFLYLGQIEKHKGIIFLVESFIDLCKKQNIQAELNIAGDGSEFKKLQSMVKDHENIILHGKVDRVELPKLFEQTNMTVVPSLCYENSPTVIFESFSFGVPVLASRVEGIAELIKEGENGITFETGNMTSLQEKILYCIENIDEIVLMGDKTFLSLEGLSQRDYIQKLDDLYNC
ncbi:MAG: hypothetical protein A2725_00190 [Candidatus Magasanikbacteria bacterium RIFCSPHIGHO2_01_FULL_33_34]|uniref:Glycosyltransferase subfamily 4-like N-terminal domain-containing protein n=1 Tax=Candidatus Magasanikbacteria bacterium RIFCSPHIGHO2_01_FULL_33_34 TaxID=1798671 RepID=A0A1F6LL17_9BACT|nr:MAG: hypothetical protein A2725_00190 [Candidatus Magasanikbacteria bacterium RIFCSPHIGHO2_01_FULL_33_34]OGH65780.1 MAG: hypothetical protein A3B83_02860 [Candidatus Magasanikbacteria bacterium RIFCSPHIGHO2_02_FULL_33_17]OGH75145.1 MAG: hypothetical protein A3A89_03455 [Candidatus Magasanikbacteria bacterium RIFCSPLOWO2_01_FULL_33_34]OGH81223.1 MAG: hypothetical protein A3F93_04155 [Candidatus Magasanikbacteria bacterium RIFCSPLOWO2_12_FULL_34_7]